MRKPVHILLVEDNEGDILLTTEALEESEITSKISVVRNGKDALDWVFKRHQHEKSEDPDLILLDINLPLKSGHEVLQAIKSDNTVKHIPVIMLTTSSSEQDINLSYQYAANCYITKPVEVRDFLNAISTLCRFWVKVVTLPKSKI